MDYRQKLAIEKLLQGKKKVDVATLCGVGKGTINAWLNEDEFSSVLKKRQNQVLKNLSEINFKILIDENEQFQKKLIELMKIDNPMISLKAVTEALKILMKLKENAENDIISARLDNLELLNKAPENDYRNS